MLDQYLFARDVYTEAEIKKLFHRFRTRHHYFIHYNPETIRHYRSERDDLGITHLASQIYEAKLLTDYFVESSRIQCRNINFRRSPLQYFQEKRKVWLPEYQKLIKDKHDPKHQYRIFRKVIKSGVIRECDTFPISIPLSIFKLLQPNRILDMSAGWGDRLLAALMYQKADYVGVDPNSSLHPQYQKMIDLFGQGKNFRTVEAPFEEANLEGEYFDLMFSSPPYFIAEQYSDDANQSFNKSEGNLEKWLNDFMFPSLEKIYQHLTNGGLMVLVINNSRVKKEVVVFVDQILRKAEIKMTYLGMQKYQEGKTLQPMWFFQKRVEITKPVIRKTFAHNSQNQQLNQLLFSFLKKQKPMPSLVWTEVKEADSWLVSVAYVCSLLQIPLVWYGELPSEVIRPEYALASLFGMQKKPISESRPTTGLFLEKKRLLE